jgi:hypothetical protein
MSIHAESKRISPFPFQKGILTLNIGKVERKQNDMAYYNSYQLSEQDSPGNQISGRVRSAW